jgi:vesicle transport protein SEC22
MSIVSEKFVFSYMVRDSLCFLTMTESSYPKRVAFLYLDEVADMILGELANEYGNEVSGSVCISHASFDACCF